MEHYFSEKPTSRLNLRSIEVSLLGNHFSLFTGSGVFSKNKADIATKILIENALVEDSWNVLDIGCGYGIVTIALALKYSITPTMLDINARAVKLTKMNLRKNKVSAEVFQSNLYEALEPAQQFDTIISNPPHHAGRDVCYAIIDEALPYLKEGGLLQMVARHSKGGKQLSLHMKEVFGNVREVVKQSGFRVYVSEKQ